MAGDVLREVKLGVFPVIDVYGGFLKAMAVRGVENYPQEFSIRGDLAANRGLHSLDACQGVGYGTDTADPRSDLRDLFHRLTYGEFLNTPDRGDGEPVSSLDNTLIIHLHGKLRMAFMSRGWRDFYNFRQLYASFSIQCYSGGTVDKALPV